MDILSIMIGAALLGAAGMFVYKPFQQKGSKGPGRGEAAAGPQARRESLLSALRDLDFDYKTGKVSEDDYSPLRAQLLAETAGLTRQEQDKDDQLEALIQSRRNRKEESRCSECGTPLSADQKFCSKCGASATRKACPSCGGKVKPSDYFCTSCGSRIQFDVSPAGGA